MNPTSQQPHLAEKTRLVPIPLIELRNITKRFPGVVANNNISLNLYNGETHALLGENGAGKSTLLNILAGMLQPEAGQILLNGQAIKLTSPSQALKHGIGTVYQHFTLVSTLSVLENVLLGLTDSFILNLGQAEQRLQTWLDDFGLAVPPQVKVSHLSLGQQQRVEIIKALFRGSRILLLDEPTSVLTPPEVRELAEVLRRLRARGVAVLLVTHKLAEALALSDRMTVLRQGRRVGELGPADLARQDQTDLTEHVVSLMFGSLPPDESKKLKPGPTLTSSSASPAICTLTTVSALDDRGIMALNEINLKLYPGEIVGLAGVDGNGQKELAEVLAGQRRVSAGQIIVNGINLANGGVGAARKAGISYISDDRLGEAVVPSLSVAENAALKVINQPPFSQRMLLNRAALAAHANHLIRQFNITTTGPWARLDTLSGGNIQKLLLARELIWQPNVLICHKPTQGLDVLTSQFVLQTLRQRADQGLAVILISAELDDLLAWCNRVGVMYRGRLFDVVPTSQADVETLGRRMVGLAA